jgi:hypothetical protein
MIGRARSLRQFIDARTRCVKCAKSFGVAPNSRHFLRNDQVLCNKLRVCLSKRQVWQEADYSMGDAWHSPHHYLFS